jgi:hypothetical protein
MSNAPLGTEVAALLRRIADDPELMQAAHLAIEDHLIELRDSCMMIGNSVGLPANGFVVRERDGSPSEIIRLGTRPGIEMALKAIADHIEAHANRSGKEKG